MKSSILICLAVILFSSCLTQKKRASIAKEYMHEHTDELAALCALHFKPVIEYRPGKVVHVSDTQYVEGEPIPCPPNEKGEVVYVKGRDKVIRDTTTIRDTIFQNDPYREADLAFKLRKAEDAGIGKDEQIRTLRSQRNTALWGLGGGLALGIGLIVVRRFI